jgi:hypothetical protein
MRGLTLYKSLGRGEVDFLLLSSTLRKLGYAAPVKKIHDLKKAGVLIGVKKGLYVLAPDHAPEPFRKETLANLIYGPSCVSLESALSFYGLLSERVETLTSVTPKRDKSFTTPVGTFTYRYLALEKYREEIDLVWLDVQHPVLMATPEKALADYILLNKVRSLKTIEDARIFLEQDLRLDLESERRFDIAKVRALGRCYRSRAVGLVADFLEGALR